MAGPARRRIGILGGMGPEATVQLMQRVIDRTAARDDEDHVPMFVDNNPQVPSRLKAIVEGTGADPGPVIAEMARRLETAGAEALAMPCNTAHHYAPQIEAAVSIPFLNMVELSADRLANDGARRVGLLASPAVKITGIFDRTFAARGIETLFPDDREALLRAIRAVKVSSRSAEAREILSRAAVALADEGADSLLVACSEFSIIADAIVSPLPVADTVDILADAIVAFSGADAAEPKN